MEGRGVGLGMLLGLVPACFAMPKWLVLWKRTFKMR